MKVICLASLLTVLFCLSASTVGAEDLDKAVLKECNIIAKLDIIPIMIIQIIENNAVYKIIDGCFYKSKTQV